MSDLGRCQAERYHNWNYYQCSRKAVIEREGKGYCKQHDPIEVKRRKVARALKYQTEAVISGEKYRREEAIRKACEPFSTEVLEQNVIPEMVEVLKLLAQYGELALTELDGHGFEHWLKMEREIDRANAVLAKLEAK